MPPVSPNLRLVSAGWRESQATAATPIAIEAFPPLPRSFFARSAEQVAPDLIGCLLVKRQPDGDLLWGVIVETEAYSQDDPACHGYHWRSPNSVMLFTELMPQINADHSSDLLILNNMRRGIGI